MNKENYYFLGYIIKTQGQKGDMVLMLDVDNPKQYEKLESVFIEIDKDLVPFFIEKITLEHQNKAVVRFQDINPENTDFLVKRSVYLPLDLLPKLSGNKFYYHEVVNFEVIDLHHGNIGKIVDIVDTQPQALFQILYKGKEILIPVVDEIIKTVDRKNKQIIIEAPEGLIDLYIEI
ncbi:MAG: ribosome maturation factor RimM [Bacteroidales bacterium]|nr:ribosome maturation factor RimM [Bacteroidales bacterium]